MTIVYVEDAYELSEIIRKYLEREGYLVRVFDNGEDALSMIEEKRRPLDS